MKRKKKLALNYQSQFLTKTNAPNYTADGPKINRWQSKMAMDKYSTRYEHFGLLPHSVEITEITLTLFKQKFRESNVSTKELNSRNIFLVIVNFSIFHTVFLFRVICLSFLTSQILLVFSDSELYIVKLFIAN